MSEIAAALPVSPVRTRLPRAAAWLLFLGLVALLLVWAGEKAARREADAQADAIRRTIEIHALGLRGAAAKYHYLPFTAAQQAEVLSVLTEPGDPPRRQRANRYLEEVNRRSGADALYVMDMQGRTLAASNWNTPQSFVDEVYANRPYFIDAQQGRSALFYGVGKTTGVPGLFLSAPVRRDGTVIGVAAVKVSLRDIEAAWSQARDPIVLSDARGIVFLGNTATWLYNAVRPLSPEDLSPVRAQDQYGTRQEFPALPWSVERATGQKEYLVRAGLEGRTRQFLALDELLPEFGWTLTVMSDHAPVTRARNLALVLGGLATGVLLLGGLYWRLLGRRLVEQRDARIALESRVAERTRELQEAHSFRKAMEDSLLVGMRARDLEGRIIYVNPALCQMVGYDAGELVGQLPPYSYWHPEELDKHWRDSEAALSGQAALTGFESRIRHRDGRDVHTMVYTAPLIDSAGQHSGWMSSVVDVTAQRLAQTREHDLNEKLERSERMAILGEISSTLAHELNQPLMALSNFASAAKAFAEQGRQGLLVDSLDGITAQAQRAAEIVQRVRDLIKQRTAGAVNAASVDICAINDIVENVLTLLQPELRQRQARASTRLARHLPAVRGDRVLLGQVLLNLVVNALQAMAEAPAAQRVVTVATEAVDGGVLVRVTDRGPGVTAAVGARIFDPLFTTKVDGLGLGLNICRTIIESHGGRLWFENQPSGGVAFIFELPGTAWAALD